MKIKITKQELKIFKNFKENKKTRYNSAKKTLELLKKRKIIIEKKKNNY